MTGRRRSIPWDEEGFLAAFARWQDLVATPPASRRANPMASYFVERYGRTRGLAHFTRWLKIGDFLARHIIRLQREGLVWATPDGALEMREENYMAGEPDADLYTYAMTKRMLYQGLRALRARPEGTSTPPPRGRP